MRNEERLTKINARQMRTLPPPPMPRGEKAWLVLNVVWVTAVIYWYITHGGG